MTPPIPLEADYRKYPAEHSRSAGRAGFPEIDCLLNDPAPVYKLAPSGSECEPKNCVASKEQKSCCTENTAPSDVSSPCNCNRGFSRSRYPQWMPFARTPQKLAPTQDPDNRCGGSDILRRSAPTIRD